MNGRKWVLLATAIVLLALPVLWFEGKSYLAAPEEVVEQFVRHYYAQDYDRAYDFISLADQQQKSKEAYLREKATFSGFTQEAVAQLADYVVFQTVQVEQIGNEATVEAKLSVPDGNSAQIRDILFADLEAEDEEGRRELLNALAQLHQEGELPTLEIEETFELRRERGRWRIFENWGTAIRVHFSAEVKNDLPWEFESLQETVLARPGETLQAFYRVKNLSDEPITAKARHIDQPEDYLASFNIVQCFCLVQQTLRPGQEMELPLMFWIAEDVPHQARDFYIHYEFYPVESFPAGS